MIKASPDVSLSILEQRNYMIVANRLRVCGVVTVADKAAIPAIELHHAGGSGTKPHSSIAVFKHGIRLICLRWSGFPVVLVSSQAFCQVVGHVANRLQAAIYREVVNLINLGVVDVADADTAVCWGPGLRWGIMGPSMLFHLGGGEGGIQHFMEHLSGPVAMWWKDLGSFTEWPEGSKETVAAGVIKAADGRSVDELAQMRDEVLLELVKLRVKQAEESTAAIAK